MICLDMPKRLVPLIGTHTLDKFAQTDSPNVSDAGQGVDAPDPASALEGKAVKPGFSYEVTMANEAIRALAAEVQAVVATAVPAPIAAPALEATLPAAPEIAALPPAEAGPKPALPAPVALSIPPGTGHVSMFISKKTGKLYVRRNFLPIFETPVVIRNPASPLGSHLFTAMDVKDNGATVRWTALDVPDAPPPPPAHRLRKGEPPQEPVISPPEASASEALDRIIIPDDARALLAELIVPGTSLIVSDQGFGRETGPKGTDFIILTR